MVISVVGILGAYAVTKGVSTADATSPSQAQKMASDIRHAQTLASTWGASLCFMTTGVGGNQYHVTRKGVSTCPTSPDVTDPATGAGFSVTLQKSLTFSSATTELTFNSLGQPGAAAAYTLGSGAGAPSISVAALTGYVTVSP